MKPVRITCFDIYKFGIRNLQSAIIVGALLFALGSSSAAQQLGSVRRIGYLFTGFQPPKEFLEAMHSLGYADGKNIVIEYRFAEGREERLTEFAAELVKEKVEVIVAPGGAAGLAAKQATKTIPVVYMGGGDPVALGLVDSLARPGGNVTGFTELAPDLTAKRLEILRESFPKVSTVAVLVRGGALHVADHLRELDAQAKPLRFRLKIVEVRGAEDFAKAFSTITRERPGALIELPNPLFHSKSKRIVDFALKNKIPNIFHSKDFVEAGGLMAYGADFTDLYRRAAILVDKLLKGAKPADLPVERPTKFELVINLKTAKQIGLTIPPNVLARADRVVR
jgi:putative tryptophan/tyrosine transport system substrate-binding protein